MKKRPRVYQRDPIARDLRSPKYRPQVVEDRTKRLPRKNKHKDKRNAYWTDRSEG